jgi:hypothetical protein
MLMEAVKQDIEMAQKVEFKEFLSSFSTINMLFLELNTRNVRENLGKVWAEGEFTSNPALLNTTNG